MILLFSLILIRFLANQISEIIYEKNQSQK